MPSTLHMAVTFEIVQDDGLSHQLSNTGRQGGGTVMRDRDSTLQHTAPVSQRTEC